MQNVWTCEMFHQQQPNVPTIMIIKKAFEDKTRSRSPQLLRSWLLKKLLKKKQESRSPQLSPPSHPRVQLQCLGFSVTIENMILFYKSFDVIVAILDQVNCNRALAREIVILQTTWNLHLHCYWISLRKNLSQVASPKNIPDGGTRLSSWPRQLSWSPWHQPPKPSTW